MNKRFLHSPRGWNVAPPLMVPTSLAHENNSPYLRGSSGLWGTPDSNRFHPPELITYDKLEKKSAQELLYESAQTRSEPDAKDKWTKFTRELNTHMNSKKYGKDLVKSLDDTKQWAALHYAVFNNNTHVFDQLTDGEKRFKCDIKILTGTGENVLHVAARSNFLWQTPTSPSYSTGAIVVRDKNVPGIIYKLIKLGADIDHADDEGRTPLHLAAMEGRLPLVKLLLANNANIYARTKLNANVLHFTFIPNDLNEDQLFDMFKYVTEQHQPPTTAWNYPWRNKQPILAQMRMIDNQTPLAVAVRHPQITEKIIRNLLDDINKPEDRSGQAPTESHLYKTQIFIAIEQVAKRRLGNYKHLRPLSDACTADMFNQLFHLPCQYDNITLLKWLIEESSKFNNRTIPHSQASGKVDLNTPDYAGYTPLLTAVFYRSIECVRHLLQCESPSSKRINTPTILLSINIGQTNKDGENILHICAKHPESELFNNLFNIIWDLAVKRELPKKKDNNGNLPLHVAARNKQTIMCEKFLTAFKCSDDINLLRMKNNQGQTAAHVATEAEAPRIGPERHYFDKHKKEKYHHDQEASKEEDDNDHNFGLPILELMWKITSKDGPNSPLFEKNDDRKTCLHLAAAKGHKKIVQFLVEKVQFEIDPIANRRLTPLHLACENGHKETIAYLIEHGASPTLRTAELYNSLEIAILNQEKDVVKELLTLPNWRELMRNAQPIHYTESYDTPMRKLIRYLPEVAVWLIDNNLTRSFGGQGKHVFKKVYDYEFYMDVFSVKQWYKKGKQSSIRVVCFCKK